MFSKKHLFLSASAVLLLAACGNGDDETGDTGEETTEETSGDMNELTVWTWDPNFNVKALEMAEERYQEENPDFSLNIIENAQEDVVQKLNTSLSSGVDTGLPQIVFIEDYRAPSFLNSYDEAFYPLGDYYNTDEFADYKVAAGSVDDNVYNIPFDTGVTGLYVRTDYLEDAGYSLEDLEDITWDEYIEIGKDVYDQTGIKWLTNDHGDLGIMRVMLQSSGVWWTEEDGTTPYIADNMALKEAFEDYKEMNDSGIMNVHNEWDQFIQTFNNGDVVTVPTGNWISASIMQAEDQSGKWGIAPIPRQNIEGSVNASNLGGSSIYVLQGEGQEAAAEFLAATFGSDVDFYQDLVTEINALGAYEPATEGEAYEQESEFYGGQQIFQDLAEWTQEIPEVDFGQRTYEIQDILAVALQEYLNGADLDEVLQNAQEQAESNM
ncbi:lactose-binding protein [Alkalibacterium putridalgicola]|uniref:ABC transporter substrate-binding protein n=1 Tax=Alkalibacterium putridalgicola TaxID=426703 RepID=A0A1H7TDI2_9LACT|nr:extracellular solute-binding protein [Alkalibacterium putridalgicola]GEK89430.1 ABC transporter substrate-binding protein [Alkalibacterium putridalgicola]SEL82942.1 lactose-binding protein [Alkalibacterium putridalgicola]